MGLLSDTPMTPPPSPEWLAGNEAGFAQGYETGVKDVREQQAMLFETVREQAAAEVREDTMLRGTALYVAGLRASGNRYCTQAGMLADAEAFLAFLKGEEQQ